MEKYKLINKNNLIQYIKQENNIIKKETIYKFNCINVYLKMPF